MMVCGSIVEVLDPEEGSGPIRRRSVGEAGIGPAFYLGVVEALFEVGLSLMSQLLVVGVGYGPVPPVFFSIEHQSAEHVASVGVGVEVVADLDILIVF